MIWNREIETLPRSEMQRLQTERLQRIVAYAYERVPLYRQRYDEAGVGPDAIKHLEDLAKLPFTRKYDLRENYPFGLFAVPTSECIRLHASSGTKGKPTVVGYTRNDIDMWCEAVARVFCMGGGQPGDMFQNAYGYGLFTGGLGFHDGVQRAGGTVVPVSGGNTPRQIMLMQDFQSKGLGCTPSYALNIADALEEATVDRGSINLRYGFFGAEPWSDAMRAQIEAKLGIDAMDIYGLSEITGPGVSCECKEAKDGLHVNEDFFLPEIIDPNTGAPLPDGEWGELVFTTLTKEAIPMIRYRTGDITKLNHEKCKCGRTTVRMNRLKGRADDMLIIRGVNVFPSEVERELLGFTELAPHYQLMLDRERALDEVEVQVELSDTLHREWGGLEAPQVTALKRRVAEQIKNSMGISVAVTLTPPKTIARSEGKAIRVIDRRKI